MKTLLSISLMFISILGYSQSSHLIELKDELAAVNVQLETAFKYYSSDNNQKLIEILNDSITLLSANQAKINQLNASRKRRLTTEFNNYRYEYSKNLGTPEEQSALKFKMDSVMNLIKTEKELVNQPSIEIHKLQAKIDSLKFDSNERFETYYNIKSKRLKLENQIDSEMVKLRSDKFNKNLAELTKTYGKDKALRIALKSPFVGLTLSEFNKFGYSGNLVHSKGNTLIYKTEGYDINTQKVVDRYLVFTNNKLTSITNKLVINN